MNDKTANQVLRELFLDYFNNYLTIEKFAEHNNINVEVAQTVINAGRELHEDYVEMNKDFN